MCWTCRAPLCPPHGVGQEEKQGRSELSSLCWPRASLDVVCGKGSNQKEHPWRCCCLGELLQDQANAALSRMDTVNTLQQQKCCLLASKLLLPFCSWLKISLCLLPKLCGGHHVSGSWQQAVTNPDNSPFLCQGCSCLPTLIWTVPEVLPITPTTFLIREGM